MNDFNIMLLLPEIFLVLTAMGFLMAGVFQGNRSTDVLTWSSCISVMIAGVLLLRGDWATAHILNNMLVIDSFANIMKVLILIGIFCSLAISVQYIYQERIARFEYPVLILMAGIGMLLMVSANNMLSLYMALELQSLSLYVLAAFHRNCIRSSEAAAKYFILGALSSGMLLFGISLIYGFTGSFDFQQIQAVVNAQELVHPGFIVGMVFVLAAMAFKISAVPFHMWTPDVYQGAPSSVTAFFAIVPKIAALGLLCRLLFVPFEGVTEQWTQILYFVSLASLVVGSFAGLAQRNIKRLMAYSSIGNMGYALIGLVASSAMGVEAVVVYLLIYMIMTAGTFSIILNMRKDGLAVEDISDLSGFSKTHPIQAYCLAFLMFSMAGIPPLAGFFGKLFIFQAAVASEFYVLATLGICASVVSAFYYLRIIKVMFFDDVVDQLDKRIGLERRIVLLLSMMFILGFIFWPNFVMESAAVSVSSLISK